MFLFPAGSLSNLNAITETPVKIFFANDFIFFSGTEFFVLQTAKPFIRFLRIAKLQTKIINKKFPFFFNQPPENRTFVIERRIPKNLRLKLA